MITMSKVAAYAASLSVLLSVAVAPESPLGLQFLPEAHAIVGAPVTPVSVAGVARRTTRRTVAVASTTAASQSAAQAATAQQQSATAQQQAAVASQPAAAPATAAGALPLGTVVQALPAGCTQVAQGGVQYSRCGADYYRAVFQGNNLVYVTAQP